MKTILFLSSFALFFGCGQSQHTVANNQQTTAANNQASTANNQPKMETKIEKATFGAGCFWCVETMFAQLKGVEKVESGYMGGSTKNPSYKQVCEGNTGHAEVVQITFNPELISYRELVDILFHVHDPTTLNRQGADVGTQYRSAVFYHDDAQKAIAEEVKKATEEAGLWSQPIVTEITAAATFYVAEDYHQNYFNLNPNQGYCQTVIAPKVAKFRAKYADKIKQD